MSLFKSKPQLVHVQLFYREEDEAGCEKIFIVSKEEVKKLSPEEMAEKGIKIVNTYWKPLSWQDRNNINHASEVRSDGVITGQVDFNRWRDLRVKQCLKEWDIKDEDGKDVPCNHDTINCIDAYIMDAIIDEFEKVKSLEFEEEVKN
ncbi:MAG: hypothetical protein ACTSQA_05005 [Candidatus Heimdallarchaeaceae archaeon]